MIDYYYYRYIVVCGKNTRQSLFGCAREKRVSAARQRAIEHFSTSVHLQREAFPSQVSEGRVVQGRKPSLDFEVSFFPHMS